ncbi:hypothetical protein AOL_s00215g253 [Orbilia oligospora ATCC 24927]|uniref:Polycomb protein VEFS-Box domain-containing protein n=1 Tax=Arthrobotrys oligospora (strain ATCC 24927 / CBS 115.81 / DSM 1491) TaxID=756982 RepID=G1XTX4_ARTOA|nr:hypothetical protein AOL_s00215g253 [Orbilia oligospora ATCC 24927]EGX43517.1 hypothetical protein AOL_s00215g253 [Orbilia oligospora ATCC 24927]
MRRKREPTLAQVIGARSRNSGFRAGYTSSPGARVSVSVNSNTHTSSSNNNNNNNNNNASSLGQPPLTLSDAYQGNLLLYNFFAKYSQKVFLERNITRILCDQARLLKAENEGRKGSRKYWNRDGRPRKMCEIVRRLGVVPEIDDEVKFGLKVEVMRELLRTGCQPKECEIKLFAIQSSSSSSRYACSKPRGQEEQTKVELLTETAEILPRPGSGADQQTLHLKRHFVIPLSTFAIKDDGNQKFASSGYEIVCRIWLGQAGEGADLAENTSGERSYETRLRLDENLVCNDGQSETTVAAVKTGEVELDTDTDLDLETLQLKLSFGWNKSINYQILGNGKKKQRQQQHNTSNVVLMPKRRKQIRIDYTFRGHIKNFDEQDAHKHSTVNLNDKLYVFSYHGSTYTCVICQNTTFQSLDRLRFHLLHTHTYFACSSEWHKDLVKIMVEPAVQEGKRFSQPPGNNDRKFTWIRPKGLGDRAFNLGEYLKGDTSWARGVVVPEAERKLMNAPGRMLRKMHIVPDLNFKVEKRKCIAPVRGDGKGYVRFVTRETVTAGDDVSESDDDIDENWVTTKINERIEKSSFSSAGQEFLKLWGGHVMVEGPRSSHHLHDCLIRFCRLNKKALKPTPLRQEFDKFVTALRLRGQVDRMLVKECKKVLDST